MDIALQDLVTAAAILENKVEDEAKNMGVNQSAILLNRFQIFPIFFFKKKFVKKFTNLSAYNRTSDLNKSAKILVTTILSKLIGPIDRQEGESDLKLLGN